MALCREKLSFAILRGSSTAILSKERNAKPGEPLRQQTFGKPWLFPVLGYFLCQRQDGDNAVFVLHRGAVLVS